MFVMAFWNAYVNNNTVDPVEKNLLDSLQYRSVEAAEIGYRG